MKSKLKKYIPSALGYKIKEIRQKILGFYYSGTNYYCPFCKKSFRKMLTGGSKHPVLEEKQIIGSGYRQNCVCPKCLSTDRDRLIFLYLKEKTNIFSEKLKVLHISPSISLKKFISSLPNIDYTTGIKYHEGFYYSKNSAILDITDIPFKNNEFDIIICNHVLEHILDDKKAMTELFRVLKPDGWAILQVPISHILKTTYEDKNITTTKEREKYFGQFDHVRIYGQDYIKRLEDVGFKVETHNPNKENWGISDITKYAINPDEDIFIARK